MHVDGASGGFVAPFIDPDLVWDFRLARVASINTSGHKYGLVYPGVGWIVWRDSAALPEDLIFWVNYLGDEMPTFALNFSRPGAQVVAQYYLALRLGFEGYRRVQGYSREVATSLAGRIEELGPFELLTRGDELPVFAFTLKEDVGNYTVFDVSKALRERGWQVPAYTFPANRTDLAALRVVVRQGFSHDLADLLVNDLKRQLPQLRSSRRRSTRRRPGPASATSAGVDCRLAPAPRRSGAHFVQADLVPFHTQDLVVARLRRLGAEALRLHVARLHVGFAEPQADSDRGASLLIHQAQEPLEAGPLSERGQRLLTNDGQVGLEKIRWTVQRTHAREHLASPPESILPSQ